MPRVVPRTQNSINRRTQALVQCQNCKHVFDSILWNQPTEKANLGICWSLKLEQLDPICLPSPKWLIENQAIIVIDVRVIKSYPPPWLGNMKYHRGNPHTSFISAAPLALAYWLLPVAKAPAERHDCAHACHLGTQGMGNLWLPVDLDFLLLVVLVYFLPSQIPFS